MHGHLFIAATIAAAVAFFVLPIPLTAHAALIEVVPEAGDFRFSSSSSSPEIAHDAEYNLLKVQRSEQWAKDDLLVDDKLAAFHKKNGGRPANIIHILVDDVGFGDLGIPELNAIRGYKTPSINKFGRESMRFARFYTEPSCTPTRVAFMPDWSTAPPQRHGGHSR